MARIRTIKPEFWTSEQVMNCSPMARLLFIGLWNFCDDAGNHVVSAKTIKANVFPGDDIQSTDVQRLLDELSSNELIVYYSFENKDFLHVTGWHHQKIDKPTYKHPPFKPELSKTPRRAIAEPSPPEGKGSGMEGNVENNEAAAAHVAGAREDEPPAAAAAAAVPPEGQDRTTQIAVWLRKAEKARGKQPTGTMSSDARIRAWADTGVTDAQLAEAYELAVADRDKAEDRNPIGPGFLDIFVGKVLNPPAVQARPQKPPTDAWWTSNAGIDRKARELGLYARATEDYASFKDRIFDEIRKREGKAA